MYSLTYSAVPDLGLPEYSLPKYVIPGTVQTPLDPSAVLYITVTGLTDFLSIAPVSIADFLKLTIKTRDYLTITATPADSEVDL